ncbi:MAG: exonuclease domain-containing protein [Alphaproteobacteria bacterium]|nr:exonuclease domain-containing protein [Alphaproteobacteria bacterium]
MREVVFDTETTGLDPRSDRIIEVGCVEIVNLMRTGKTYSTRIDPERPVSDDTTRITGITDADLRGRPRFLDVVKPLLDFIGEAQLVAHNASFDRGFLNAELARLDHPQLSADRFVDSADLARKQKPGAPASLDAVCRRFSERICEAFGVSSWEKARPRHGALLDAELLAVCYLELRGGRERAFDFAGLSADGKDAQVACARPRRPQPLPSLVTMDERSAWEAFVATLGDAALWRKYAS